MRPTLPDPPQSSARLESKNKLLAPKGFLPPIQREHKSSSPVLLLQAAPRGPACLQPSSWAGGVPGQLGGNSGLLGTWCVSIIGEAAGDPEDAGFSKRAGKT